MGINKNFVVRNGLEVADNLLFADDGSNRVGINTANPEFSLEVRGDSKLGGRLINAGIAGTSGFANQYLKSTGDGWEWESFPVNRQVVRYTLVASQTRVPAAGNFPDFVLSDQDSTSIYIDGVKQTVGDYSIDAGGGSITLFAAAFGGEEIEIIAHGQNTVGTGNTGIRGVTTRKAGIASGTPGQVTIFDFVGLGVTLDGKAGLVTVYIDSGGLSDVISDPSPQLGGNLEVLGNDIFGTGNINLTGVVTATEFVGDGANLTGITTLIKAGDFITLTTSGGITTITGQQGGATGFFNDDQAIAGIHTISSVVGLGTTNPRFQAEIGAVGAAGTQLWVNGDARITGILTVGSSSITLDGDNDLVKVGTAVTIDNEGIDVTGVVTATSFDGDLTGQHRVYTAGVSNSDDYTIAMFLDPTQGGHTYNRYDLGQKLQYNPSTGQLSNVGIISATGQIISGVTTHQGEVNFQSNVNLGDNDSLRIGDGQDLSLYHTGTVSRIDDTGDGGIEIRANPSIKLQRYSSGDMGVFNSSGSVELYYDGSKKFETAISGVDITGGLDVSGVTTTSTLYVGLITSSSGEDVDIDAATNRRVHIQDAFSFSSTGKLSSLSGSMYLIGGGEQTTRPNIFLGNGDQLIIDGGSGSSSGVSLKGGGGSGTVRVDEGNFIVGSNITLDRSAGSVTASSFVGDGSGLTGITAVGSGIEVRDNDTAVGTAATVNFGSNLTVSALSGGICTITAGSNSDIVEDETPQLGGNLDLNTRTIDGSGNINITGSLRINGVSTFVNNVYAESSIDITDDLNVGGITTFVGQVRGASTGNLLPALFSTTGDLPSASSYHGAFAHVHSEGHGFFAHGGNWVQLLDTGSELSELTNVTTDTPSNNDVLTWNGSSWAPAAAQGGGGGTGTGYFNNEQTNAGIHTTASHVGLGTTNPITSVQVNDVYGIETGSGTFTATAGVAYTANTYAVADFVNAEYTLFFQHSSGIQSQKVLVMDDGTTAYAQEYGIMSSNDLLVSVGATVKSGNVELEWTPETGVSGVVTYRYTRETMI